MKVNDPGASGVGGPQQTHETKGSSSGGKTRQSKFHEQDQVSLSNLSTALQAGDTNSPQRTARVDELSAAVSSGRYQVNAKAVSSAIISSSMRA